MSECKECFFWKKDLGIHCFNGWTGWDRNDGHCHFDVREVYKEGDNFCRHFKKKYEDEKIDMGIQEEL